MSMLLLFNPGVVAPTVAVPDLTLFGYINAIDTASIVAGSEASSMRSYNLSDPILQRRWRALATSTYFLALFNDAIEVDFLALAGATLSATDQVRHRLYDDSGVLALDVTVNAGVADGYGVHFYQLVAPIVAAQWRCDIVATSRASQGYFDVGRAWAGPAFTPSNGISPGWNNGWMDLADPGRSKYSGVSFIGAGAQYRAVEFSLDYMTEADKETALDMMLATGIRNQVFFVPFTAGHWPRQAILGYFANQALITEPAVTFPKTFSQKFRIEQAL